VPQDRTSLPPLQEQFKAACPIVTADLATLSTSPLIGSTDQAALAKAAAANNAICAAGGQINVTDLKAFHDSLLPAAIAIVNGNPLIPDQTAILLALNTFGPIMQQMVDQVIAAVAATNAASATSAHCTASKRQSSATCSSIQPTPRNSPVWSACSTVAMPGRRDRGSIRAGSRDRRKITSGWKVQATQSFRLSTGLVAAASWTTTLTSSKHGARKLLPVRPGTARDCHATPPA
jgi:hypothetical protein